MKCECREFTFDEDERLVVCPVHSQPKGVVMTTTTKKSEPTVPATAPTRAA